MQIYCASHVGKVRARNEDAIACRGWTSSDETPVSNWPLESDWVVVADGMGGHVAGDIASDLVVDFLGELLPQVRNAADLRKALALANERILKMSLEYEELRGMGSTVAGLLKVENEVIAFNAGDSRIYALRDADLMRISVDHRIGHALTSCLGGWASAEPTIHVIARAFSEDTAFLLCTDGLTDVVPEEFIATALAFPPSASKNLIAEALRRGAPDNVSVAVTSSK